MSKDKKRLSRLIIIRYLNCTYEILNFCTSKLFSVLQWLQPSECGEARVTRKERKENWKRMGRIRRKKKRKGNKRKVEKLYGRKQ